MVPTGQIDPSINRSGIHMKTIKELLLGNKFLRDNAGATAIEYGLIAALIAVAAISAMQGLGGAISATFNTTSSTMASAAA